MWCLTFIMLLATLAVIMVVRFESRRKRILASRIPGPNGTWLIGVLPLFIQGPEKLIKNGLNLYRM